MLLRDITKIKESIPVNATLDYEKLKPFVSDAERIVKETISSVFYDELDAYLENPLPVNAYFDNVIKKLQDSISFLAFHLGFDILNTVFSNQGFHRIETEDGSKKALFQRQEENLKKTFKVQGYNKLDLTLEYLESNKAEFGTWVASDAYTLMKSNIINSAREFSYIYNINNSRLAFLKLRSTQTVAEDFDIIPLIGLDLFAEIKTQILADSLSTENQALIPHLKKAVAYRTIFRGGLSLLAELNDFGFLSQEEKYFNTDNFKKESPATLEIAAKVLDDAGQRGASYLRSIESFLKKNLTDYPLYANSNAYDETGSVFDLKSTSKIGVI